MRRRRRRYNKAPIVEALIDLRVKLPESTPIESLRRIHENLSGLYGAAQELIENTTLFEFRPGKPAPAPQTTSAHVGYRFDRLDESRVLQVKRDGFAFSALAPYDEWASFNSEAKTLWELYRDTYTPTHVTRVAVRYINRIDLPLAMLGSKGSFKLEDYFKTYPQVTEELDFHTMDGFVMQIQVPQRDIESMLVVKQGVVPPPQPGIFSVLLDLDLFREVLWDSNDDKTIWGFFEKLRDRKNDVFEASITQKTRELFD